MTEEYISDPAHPVEECREPTKAELKHGIDSLAELAAARYDENKKLRAELEACEAANAHLLAQSRIKAAPDYQAGKWRQHETRRL